MATHEYEHRQIGVAVLALVILLAILPLRHFVYAAASRSGGILTLMAVVLLLVLLALGVLFSSLNVQVMYGHIIWSFGPGFFRRMVPLERIAEVRPCRNPWPQGLGIRRHDGVQVYAVAGGPAVELELEDGGRIRLGTNDPNGLVRAVRAAQQAD